MTKSIVVIGGGTGSYTVLKGLKNYTNNLTAIVSMFDSGGSSGKLRDEFGYLPPGDLRRCILALAPEDGRNEFLRKLFDYRFDKGNGLTDHSLGNLIITAATEINGGNILKAIDDISKTFDLKGKVLPVSLDNCILCAELENGTVIKGETHIDVPKHDPSLRITRLFTEPDAYTIVQCIDAIKSADTIVIGPGDLYTSIIPNLLAKGITDALKETKAKKVYVCNVMTKYGETCNGKDKNFSAKDFLSEIEKYIGTGAIDYLMCNTQQVKKELLERYAGENSYPVEIGSNIKGVKIITGNFLNEKEILRHDSQKLARKIIEL